MATDAEELPVLEADGLSVPEAVVEAATLEVEVVAAAADDEDADAVTVDEISDDPAVEEVTGTEEEFEVQFGRASGKRLDELLSQSYPHMSGEGLAEGIEEELAEELDGLAIVDEPERVDVKLAGILIGWPAS